MVHQSDGFPKNIHVRDGGRNTYTLIVQSDTFLKDVKMIGSVPPYQLISHNLNSEIVVDELSGEIKIV